MNIVTSMLMLLLSCTLNAAQQKYVQQECVKQKFNFALDQELIAAVKGNNVSLVRTLLFEQQANPNAYDDAHDFRPWRNKLCVLHIAAAHGFVEIVEMLLKTEGLNIDRTVTLLSTSGGSCSLCNTALLLAVSCGQHGAKKQAPLENYERIVKLLIDAKANLDKSNHHQITPLMRAIQEGKPSLIKMLLDAGAHSNATTMQDIPTI